MAAVVVPIAAAGAAVYLYNNRQGDVAPRDFSYIVPGTEDAKKGLGAIHRHPEARDKLCAGPSTGEKTMYETFQRGVKLSGPNPCLGYRPIVDGKAQGFVWESYDSVNTRIQHLGSALIGKNLIPVVKGEGGKELRMIALFSKNLKEWVIVEQALFSQSGTTVPLYDTLGPDTVEQIVNETLLTTVYCTRAELKRVFETAPKCSTLKNVILLETPTDAELKSGKEVHLDIIALADLEAYGKANPLKANPPKPSDVATFCYTSGTTGKSKGALITHANFVSNMGGIDYIGISFNESDVHLSYLPLAHAFERIVQSLVYYGGGRVGFFQGKAETILEDLAALRPTIFPSVPRLLNRVHDKIVGGAKAAGGVKAKLFEMAFQAKVEGLKTGWLTHKLWDKLVFHKIAARVGLDRVRLMITGSAPISAHVLTFLRVVFSCPVFEGYGQTECTAGSNITHIHDYTTGHVGGPLPCNEIRLVSVPEMNYNVEDTEHNNIPVHGRGEVCYRGWNVFQGYYKMPEVTKETLDADGWLHSGDIGVWNTNGTLKIVDRKKNIFKLAQGEYVAPEKIENIYIKSDLVQQAFVYGDSLQSCLVAVIVPDPDVAKAWATSHSAPTDLASLVKSAEFKKAVVDSMTAVAKADKLFGFEQAREITLVPTAFTPNDILTPSFKLKRNEAKKLFQKEIDAMYSIVGDVAGKKVVHQDKH